ncbi:hypothetical protein BDV39DRAFT_218849 [Aspergillus sergii]|uniref:GIY-YIG domain-containing protein n=1 Tax=Aspergillus sergii TaxID=1034303 RepID=A0A5N6WMX5_9EURO|nr:hypothetical protein BDV39DRAFT_218849 [Aspergillus sergii]
MLLIKGNSLIAIGQNPENLSICGVYLHILWRRSNPQNFWLYVGQGAELRERVRTHNDIYRRKHSAEDMESIFVTLVTSEKPTSVKTQLLLNLHKMWMALVFQTLTSLHLDEYLPDSVNRLWSGHHLNVALPLCEAVSGRISFQQHLFSEDPTIRQWAESARDAFNDIRNSPDALLRQYYQNLLSKRQAQGQQTWQKKKSMNIMRYLEPTKTTVKVSHEGKMCEVSCARDPASRLAISISGYNTQGSFHTWLQTKGSRNVFKINPLVDVLEGYPLEESEQFQRRWHPRRMVSRDSSSRKHVYT